MGLFGKGEIILNLEKHNYSPGEKIRGKIELKLKKTIKARKLEVKLQGVRKDRVRPGAAAHVISNDSGSGVHVTKVYDSGEAIDGEKEYQAKNYNFELEIPQDIFGLAKLPVENIINKNKGAAKSLHLISSQESHIDWYINAQLDIPLGKDIKEKQQIEISD